MAEIIDLKTKARYRIFNQFPPLGRNEVPQIYEIRPIEYKKKSIEEFDVIFWHRLLKIIYQEPLEIECELCTKKQETKNPETAILRKADELSEWEIIGTTTENVLKIQSGEITLFFSNWKYFFKLPSGGIVSIGTKNRVTSLYIAHIAVGKQLRDENSGEAERFISLLLDEANKSYKQLFNPEKEFEEAEGLRSYILSNVYLANYKSAEFMLRTAVSQEQQLRDELFRYDATRLDLTKEEGAHISQYGLVCGMYFLSAITYFYMAIEGFINIIFHSFLKKTVKEGPLNREGRFQLEKKISDVELKLRLLPVLCDGFSEEHLNASSDVYSKFHQLTEYRNSIFHSKIENSLKRLLFVEDGFMYQCHLSEHTKQFLPSFKLKLTATDVLKVKNIVDEIINSVLQSMTESARALATEYILKSPYISYNITADGSLSIGLSNKEKKMNEAQQGVQGDGD